MNQGGDTMPGIEGLILYDLIGSPASGFPQDKNLLVHNHVIHDWCFLEYQGHILQAFDPSVFRAMHAFFTPEADQNTSCADQWQ
ncbi:hypothetical protein BGZ47_007966 [Haplosporangium gracile]|nr:hypothetical protein BGZ47_007966 [Haplosporangium gracile]